MNKILALLLLLSASNSFASNRRVIISLRPKLSAVTCDSVVKKIGATSVAHIRSGDGQFIVTVAEMPNPSFPWNLINGKVNIPDEVKGDVVSVEDDFRVKWIEDGVYAPFPSMDTFLDGVKDMRARFTMAALRPEIPWGVSRVNAPLAWSVTEGAGVKVAVIDTGIDYNHPDLSSKVDGGYNAITKSEARADYVDDNGHGTHVAGTIAASRDNRGVVGVAPRARLYAIKVLDADGSGNLSDVIDGIVWAANHHMQVANMSLGAPSPSDTMQQALRYAKGHGVVVVAAAGNSGGSVSWPGAYPETIAVAASDSNDNLAVFSSRGPEVKFIAPGVDIVSSAMGGGFANFSGTSMATPHVAGLAALAVSQGWVGLNGPDGVLTHLTSAARKVYNVPDVGQGAGMIDASRLVR